MTESFPEQQPVVAEEVMWRLRYRPEELRKKHTEDLAWYRKVSFADLDTISDPELREHLEMQVANINDSTSEQIAVPTAYTDDTFSHVQHFSRDTFEIPGGLSLRAPRGEQSVDRSSATRQTGGRMANLLRQRRKQL